MEGPASPSTYPPEVLEKFATGFAHLTANNYYVLASTVMLCYDHLLTFDDEVKYMWGRKKGFPFYLFLIFRYVTPIISLINIVSSHDPNWVGDACKNWIWFPVAVGPIVSLATGIILIFRVHAIYSQASWILYVTFPIYIAQLIVMGWAIPAGVPAVLPPGFIGCIPNPKQGTGLRLSSIYIAALVFDATIFALTFGRAIYSRLTGSSVPLKTLIIRDGTLYFAVIFAVNLTNVFLLALAPPDLSAINAPFASMITAILVARLVIHLRSAADNQRLKVSHGARPGATASMHPNQALTFNQYNVHVSPPPANYNYNSPGGGATLLGRMGAADFAVPLPDTLFDSDSRVSDETTTVGSVGTRGHDYEV